MNSLSNGFLYTLGFGWALTECCVLAVAGNLAPLLLLVIAFFVAFSILGCLDLPDATLERFGTISGAVLTAVLVFFTIQTFIHGSIGLGLIKLLVAALFVVGTVVTFAKGGSGSGDSEVAH